MMNQGRQANWMGIGVMSFLLLGCNSDSAMQQLPPGSKITLTPIAIDWDITPLFNEEGICVVDPGYYNDTQVVARLTSADDVALGGVTIGFLSDLAGNTFSGVPVLELYSDANSNGVADPGELVSANGQGEYTTNTDSYLGTASIIVRVNVSCEFKATLYVVSPNSTATTAIKVNDISGER